MYAAPASTVNIRLALSCRYSRIQVVFNALSGPSNQPNTDASNRFVREDASAEASSSSLSFANASYAARRPFLITH